MWEKNKENKIEKALEQLTSTIIINTIEYPDATTRKKGAKYICSLNKEDLTLPILKRILKYLKESTVFYSADLLEDDYGLDFDLMKANLSIDYKGGYTFVEDKWLPKYLVKERVNYKKILFFYAGIN